MLSDDLRRFIYSLGSIPHLEAILLLRQNHSQIWQSTIVAQRLYIAEDVAASMLNDLHKSGICVRSTENPQEYQFRPIDAELSDLIERLAHYYAHNLIEVTNMIHSTASQNSRVQQFADAFKFKKKDE